MSINNNRHIAILLASFLGGGVEKMMVYLANNFAMRGYKVDLLLIRNRGPYKDLVAQNVNLIDFKKGRLISSILPLIRYLKENKPDVLLTATDFMNIGAYFANLISSTNTKLVLSERTILSRKSDNNHNKIYKRIHRRIVNHVYSRGDKIIAISNGTKEDLVINYNIPEEKIAVIYNMVKTEDIVSLTAKEKRELFDQHFQDKNYNSQIVIGIGRLVALKNFHYLIDAIRLLSEENKSLKLLILGEGPERQNLQGLIDSYGLGERIKLIGFVKNPNDYMQISNVFALTSIYEGFGNVVIEAMASGLPVIVTDCVGGPKEIVDFGKYGDVVPLDNLEVLAKTIQKVLRKEVNLDVSKRIKDFSIEKISEEYLRILLD